MSKKNELLFDGPDSIDGLPLRPYTVGSFNMCAALGLSIFTGEKDADKLKKEDQIWQMAAYLWIHTGDIDDRLEAVETGKATRQIKRLMFDMPMDSIEQIMAKIVSSNEKVASAQFDVQDKPGEQSKETPPPNS